MIWSFCAYDSYSINYWKPFVVISANRQLWTSICVGINSDLSFYLILPIELVIAQNSSSVFAVCYVQLVGMFVCVGHPLKPHIMKYFLSRCKNA